MRTVSLIALVAFSTILLVGCGKKTTVSDSDGGEKKSVADTTTADQKGAESRQANGGVVADYTLTANQLYSEYVKDTGAADKKYKGKLLRVTGNWTTGGSHPEADFHINLDTGAKNFRVQCLFNGNHAKTAERIEPKTTQSLTVVGKCDGLMARTITLIRLQDCTILNSNLDPVPAPSVDTFDRKRATKDALKRKLEDGKDSGQVLPQASVFYVIWDHDKLMREIGKADTDAAFGRDRQWTYRCIDGDITFRVKLNGKVFFMEIVRE